VSGDLYMQAVWRRLRARAAAERAAALEARAEKALAIEAPRTASVKKEVASRASKIRSRGFASAASSQERLTVRQARSESEPEIRSRFSLAPSAPEIRSHLREEVEHPLATQAQETRNERTEMLLAARRESSEREQARIEDRISSRATKTREEPRAVTRVEARAETRVSLGSRAQPEIKEAAVAAPAAKKTLVQVEGAATRAHGKMLLAKTPRREAMPAIAVHGGSVSDRIRKLSGKAYDVYREIFIDSIRDSIHRNLLDNQTRPHRFFDEAPNQAEDLIFNFMADHYEDPYLDWESSPQCKRVDELGFNILSIDPILEMWFKKL
jgi:hypothetical protein